MKTKEIYKTRNLCSGCGACANSCTHNAITMKEDWKGFLYPSIDEDKCIDCNLCRVVCPTNVGSREKFHLDTAEVFVESNKSFLDNSTSGGAFGVLARHVIEKNGTVYGVCMDDDYSVYYKCVNTIDKLPQIQGSKYVQALSEFIYRKIKVDLQNGKDVLFCGCPCQVSGLKAYLRKDYDNLITIDLICHGVPSQKFFREYVLSLLSEKKDEGIKYFKFRWKTNPKNKVQPISSGSSENDVYVGYYNRDCYMTYFLRGETSRPSCYHCIYAGSARQGDYTIGDFWNKKGVKFDIDDSQGASLIIYNTHKAKKLAEIFHSSGYTHIVKGMMEAKGENGGQLEHPSIESKFRNPALYTLLKLFGIKGPQLFFKIESFIRGWK